MTEKELQAIYDAIMNKEVDKAKELINSMYFSKSQVLDYLKRYVKTKSAEEIKIYKEKYNFFSASYSDYFDIAISLINELIETDTVDFDGYTSFYEVEQSLKTFKKRLPEYQIYVDKILDIIKPLKGKKQKSLKIIKFYNLYNTGRTKYEDEFYMIATSENPVSTFCKFAWSEQTFYTKLELFKKKYPAGEDDGLADKFEMYFKEYMKLRNKEEILTQIEISDNEFQMAKSVVENVIKSGLSIYEYCHFNSGNRVPEIKNYIRRIYYGGDEDNKRATKIIKELEQKENKKFINQLIFIEQEIIHNPKFTVIDYYLSTKLHIDDFIEKVGANSMMNQFISNNFDCAYNNLYNFNKNRYIAPINKKRELNLLKSINGRVITNEEKEAIFKFLEENEIPLNDVTYMCAIRKIVNNDLDFTQKIKKYM